jgi:hypothetical protein
MKTMRDARKTEALLYTVKIHDYFRTKYGKSTTLGIDEWLCIQEWRKQGLEIECVFKGIDLAFSTNAGTVSSVLHCANAVGEVFSRSTRTMRTPG